MRHLNPAEKREYMKIIDGKGLDKIILFRQVLAFNNERSS
jgi:hypothetical protein